MARSVRVWDSREAPPQAAALALAAPAARLFGGVLQADALQGVQLVLKSPGLAPHDERIAALLGAARAQGVAVQGELDCFRARWTTCARNATTRQGHRHQRHQRQDHDDGADGLAGRALRPARGDGRQHRADDARHAGGGDSTLSADDGAPEPLPQVWVLELSSFQLDGVRGFEPARQRCSTSRRITSTGTARCEAYAAAKARVFGERAVMVINRDDPRVEAMVPAPALVKTGKGRSRAGAAARR